MSMKTRRRLSTGIWSFIGILCFLLLMFPIYWMLCDSLMTEPQIFSSPPYLVPPTPSLNSYTYIFTSDALDVWRLLMNSFILGGSTMILSVILSVPAAYALSKFPIRGKKLILLVFLISQMLPSVFNLIPYFYIFKALGVTETYLAPIIADMTMAIPFTVIMLRPFFQSVPSALAEAARIDGCNHFQSFLKVMLPICAPGVAVSLVFSFLFSYSDMIYAKTFLSDTKMWPLTTGIYQTIGRYGIQWSNAMAFAVVVTIPVLLIFICMQHYIVDGLVAGAVKG